MLPQHILNPPFAQVGPVQGYIPVLGYQAAQQPQPMPPIFAGPNAAFAAPYGQGQVLGNNALQARDNQGRAMDVAPEANDFLHFLNHQPARANRDVQALNRGKW